MKSITTNTTTISGTTNVNSPPLAGSSNGAVLTDIAAEVERMDGAVVPELQLSPDPATADLQRQAVEYLVQQDR